MATVLPDEGERRAAVEAVLHSAEPSGFVSIIGPARPLPIDASQQQQLLDAADDAFVAGIRLALASGAVLVAIAFAIGFRSFPREGPEGDHPDGHGSIGRRSTSPPREHRP